MPADFLWSPDYKAADKNTTPRVLITKYNDKYEERRADGLNNLPRVWSFTFTNTNSEIDAIDTFLRGKAGVTSFTFVPPREVAEVRVVCSDPWKQSEIDYNVSTLTATFREVFEAS